MLDDPPLSLSILDIHVLVVSCFVELAQVNNKISLPRKSAFSKINNNNNNIRRSVVAQKRRILNVHMGMCNHVQPLEEDFADLDVVCILIVIN